MDLRKIYDAVVDKVRQMCINEKGSYKEGYIEQLDIDVTLWIDDLVEFRDNEQQHVIALFNIDCDLEKEGHEILRAAKLLDIPIDDRQEKFVSYIRELIAAETNDDVAGLLMSLGDELEKFLS